MRLKPILLLLTLSAQPALAQAPDSTRPQSGTSVSGIVYDSIARRPLVEAMVQLVAAEGSPSLARAAQSDSLGRFLLSDVPDGRYMLGFLHPMLDSLGLAPPVREIHVVRQHPVRENLAIPSPGRLRTAICGATSREDSGAVVVGTVRDAYTDSPVDGATLTGEWIELSIGAIGMTRKIEKLSARTGDNGWFALCNVPRDGIMELFAVRGADSTARIDVHVPNDGFLRRDMYLGVAGDVAEGAIQTGNIRLTGTVVTAAEGRPLTDALVSIVGGPQARTNESGQWTIGNAPPGTRMLEVRSVGYYPERRPVNVFKGAAPIHITLSTLKAVLDTVRVTASRVTDQNLKEFMERRRSSGTGRFLTAEDIARRNPIFASDIFRSVSGVYMATDIKMRGAFGECTPALYIDGLPFPPVDSLMPHDINDWVDDPKRIAAIEVYTDQVPPQFQRGMAACGSIVIWLK